jgi:hypothetical protein
LSLNLLHILLFKFKDKSFLTFIFHNNTGLDEIGVPKSITLLNRCGAGVGLYNLYKVDIVKLKIKTRDNLK